MSPAIRPTFKLVIRCWPLLLLIAGVAHADDPDPKLIAKLKKKVESLVKKGKGDFFAVALVKSTYYEGDVERKSSRLVPMNGRVLQDNVTEFKSGEYCPEAEFKVIEGADAVVDAIVDHMTPYLNAPPPKKKGKQPAADSPPPDTGDWKLIGRFSDSDKADDALAKAQAAYDSEPRWEPSKKKR